MSYPTGPLRVTPEQWNAIREHYDEPADDDHLESAYEDAQNGGFDGFNEIESGRWDDDPSPYGGTYSEE